MKQILFTLFLFLIFHFTQAQTAPNLNSYTADTSKMRVWTEYCRNICLNENFPLLFTSAKKGISISKGNKHFSSIFYYYEGIGYEYSTRQDSLAIDCYEKSLTFAKMEGDMEQVGNIIRRLYYLYYLYKKNEKETALIHYVKSNLKSVIKWEVKANFLVTICNSYLFHDEYEEFVNFAFQTIDVYEHKLPTSKKNNTNIANLYRNIVGAYIQMGQFEKALEYCKIAEKYCMQEHVNLAYLYSYYVKIYSEKGQIELQKSYIQKLEQLNENFYDKQSCLGESYTALSENFLKINKLTDANKYIEKAIQAGFLSKNQEVVVEAKTIKGKILFAMKEYSQAIKLLLFIEKDAKMYDKWNYTELLKVIAQCYKLDGNSEKAYQYLAIYSLEKDTILKESAKKNIANAEAKYQNNIKLHEIKSLKAINTIQQLEEEKSKSEIAVLVLVLLMVIGVSSFTYYKYNERKRINEKLQQLNADLDKANYIKARFFGILNHDLRSPIANIIGLLRQKNDNPELFDAQTVKRLETTTLLQAENLLESMEDMLLWGKGQMNNFAPQITPVPIADLFEYLKKYFAKYEEIIQFEMPSDIILNTDADFLKAITRNLTDNAVKASTLTDKPYLKWKAWINTEHLVCLSITNNSKDIQVIHLKALFDDKETIGIKHGLGLHVIRDLAKACHCRIETETTNQKESTIKLVFE